MNLLLLFDTDQIKPGCYRIDGHRFLHIRDVLKAQPGAQLHIGMLNGPKGTGTVVAMAEDHALIAPGQLQQSNPMVTIDVICAIPRPKILRKVLYVSAMTGVRSLHLIRANRTERSYLLSPLIQRENYLPYLLDGLSQGGYTRLPEIAVHPLFRPFVEDQLPTFTGFASIPKLLANLDTSTTIDLALPDGAVDRILLAIGPEGGWVPFECELLKSLGFTSFSLGESVLRVEYALAAALAQVGLVCAQRSRHNR